MHLLRRLSASKCLVACLFAVPVLLLGCVGADSNDAADKQGSDLATENSSDKVAFDYFVSQGLTPIQAAGIVGNLDQESGMSPTIAEYGGGPGRGIAQWSTGGRWDTTPNDNVAWYAAQQGASIDSLQLQLDFIWYELTTFGYGYSTLVAATNVTAATVAFMDDYEICGACDSSNRVAHAEAALADFGSSSSGSSSSSSSGSASAPDGCSEAEGFCTDTLQCLNGHWTLRSDDPNACSTYSSVQEPCSVGDGYCTETLQCDGGNWVSRSTDPNACTSGPG
jgi:hypothetical protein